MTQFIGVYEGMANDDYCQRMIDELEFLLVQSSHDTNFGDIDNGGAKKRKDQSRFFELDAPQLAEETYMVLDACLMKYCDEHPAFHQITSYSRHVKVQKTPPKGGFHTWHFENAIRECSFRALTWMIYLNDTPDGEGTTEFIEQGVRLQPKRGTVVFFPAGWTHTHRGNPVYNCNKYIATGWYVIED